MNITILPPFTICTNKPHLSDTNLSLSVAKITLSALDLYKVPAEPHSKLDAAEMFSKLTDPKPTHQHWFRIASATEKLSK